MSGKFSLREELDRRAAAKAKGPIDSDSSAVNRVLLLPTDSIDQPVEFVRLLANHGLSLRKGRDILEILASGRPAIVDLKTTSDLADVLSGLARFGVLGTTFEVPNVDVRRVREEQQLSQPDFANCYGLEVDTIRNWEQGRNEPDGPAKVLLNVINHEPEAVVGALIRELLTHDQDRYRELVERIQRKIAALMEDHSEEYIPKWYNPRMVPPPDGYVWVLKRKQTHTD
jgi:transcriptional regulator with XRE-family HTH domain